MKDAYKVVDNPELGRYEMAVDGQLCIVEYEPVRPGVVAITHTEVPKALRGANLAGRMTAGMLADLRAKGLKIVPICAYTVAYVKGHSEWQDLVSRDDAQDTAPSCMLRRTKL